MNARTAYPGAAQDGGHGPNQSTSALVRAAHCSPFVAMST